MRNSSSVLSPVYISMERKPPFFLNGAAFCAEINNKKKKTWSNQLDGVWSNPVLASSINCNYFATGYPSWMKCAGPSAAITSSCWPRGIRSARFMKSSASGRYPIVTPLTACPKRCQCEAHLKLWNAQSSFNWFVISGANLLIYFSSVSQSVQSLLVLQCVIIISSASLYSFLVGLKWD